MFLQFLRFYEAFSGAEVGGVTQRTNKDGVVDFSGLMKLEQLRFFLFYILGF